MNRFGKFLLRETGYIAVAVVAAGGLAWAADNLTIKEPAAPSATVKSDDVAGVHYQGFKIYDGEPDSSTYLDVTGSNALKVDGSAATQPVSASSLPLPTGAATAANQLPDGHNVTVDNAAGAAAVPIQDGGNSITVDGTVAVTEPVSVDDNGSTISVDDGGGSLTIDGSVTVGAALPAGNNNIGDVDVASSALPTGAATSANQSTEITALQIIDDLRLADDGAFTPGTTAVVGLGCIEATDAMDAGDVGAVKCGTDRELDIDVISLPALPAGTNNIGDVDVLTLPPLVAGTANIGDVDVLTLPALPAGSNEIGRVRLTDGTDLADILDLTNSNPLTVAITDGSGSQITSFGGGTQYTEGDTDATITGTATLWEDTGDTLRPASAATPFPVAIISGAGSGGTAAPDDSAFTIATTNVTPMGCIEATDTLDAGDTGAVKCGADRELDIDVISLPALAAGTNNIGDVDVLTLPAIPAGNNNVGDVDVATIAAGDNNIGNVDVLSVIPGTAATSLGKAEDAVAASGDTGVLMLGRENSGGTTLTGSSDYGAIRVDTLGSVYTMTNIERIGNTLVDTDNGVAGAGVQRVVIASDQTAFSVNAALAAGTNNVGDVDVASIAAGDNNIGNVDIVSFPDNEPINVAQMNGVAVTMGNGASGTGVQRVTIANDSTGIVQPVPGTAGGLSMSKTISAASTNATNVKASAGQVYYIAAFNTNAAARYLKLYNSAGTPTCNSDTVVQTFAIPGNAAGAGFILQPAPGIAFGTGIAFCLTTGVADNDNNAVAANEIVVNIGYK